MNALLIINRRIAQYERNALNKDVTLRLYFECREVARVRIRNRFRNLFHYYDKNL